MSASEEISPDASSELFDDGPPASTSAGLAVADFPIRLQGSARYDLSASESETTSLSDLLAMAGPTDLERWHHLNFDYANPRGAAWLRETLAGRYIGLDADDLLCAAGAQEALSCLLPALVSASDHAIVILPIYPPAERAVTARCHASGVTLRLKSGRWNLGIDEIEAAVRPNTRFILINFPNSPTGAVIDPESLMALIELCRRHGLWLINDEVYRLTAFEPDVAPQIVEHYERGISINAVSKGLGLPGLRVGWIACRDRSLLARAQQAKALLSACVCTTSEVLAHIALSAETELLDRNRTIGLAHRTRLDDFVNRHPSLFDLPTYENLAFAFPRYRGSEGAAQCSERLFSELGLLVLPSILWQSSLGLVPPNHLRIGLGRIGAVAALDVWDQHLKRQ